MKISDSPLLKQPHLFYQPVHSEPPFSLNFKNATQPHCLYKVCVCVCVRGGLPAML